MAQIVDEAGIALEVDSSGFAARLRAEVEQALAEATRGAGNTVNINVTGDDFDDARMRQKIRQFEVYVNQVRTRQREQDRRYFVLLNQRINQTFNRIKLRINQLKAQLATLKNQKIEIDLDLNEDRIRERLAELARNRDLTLNVDVDLAKARAEIDAFRKEQEANAITIPVRLDEEKLKRYSRTLGETTTGTTGLTRATEGLNRTLGDSEAAAARVTALEERLTDARAKSEAATAKRSAAEEALSRAEEQHERTGAALEQAEARLAELRSQTVRSTKELEQAEADAAKARETHSVATERYFTAESKATTAKNAAERASRGLATAERDHESALTRLRTVQQRSDEGSERRVGLFRRLLSGIDGLSRGTISFGSVLSSAASGLSTFGNGIAEAAGQATGLASVLGGAGGGAGGLIGTAAKMVLSLGQAGGQISLFAGIAGAATFVVGGLSAAILAAPAAITGLAAAVGVGALAFDNFGDAIKEANTPEELKKQQEAMAKLHPEAQKVARIFNNELRPAFEGFQKEIQGRFFQGLDQPFRQLVQTINGALKPGLLRVTDSVNAFVKQLLGIVTGEQGVRRVNDALAAAKSFLDQLLPAVGNLVRSFLDLAGVEPIARAIGGAFGDILNQVSAFFDEMNRSGDAQRAVEALRGVVSNLTKEFLGVLRSATNFFTQAAPGFNNLVSSVSGLAQSLINDLGGAFNQVLQAGSDFIKAIPPEALDGLKQGIKDLAQSVSDFANSPAPGLIVDGIRQVIGVFQTLIDIATGIANVIGFFDDLAVAIDRNIPGAAALDRAFGNTDTAAKAAGQSVDGFGKSVGAAAPAAAAGATAIVNGVATPIKTLPGLTQAEFDKLPQIVKDRLTQTAADGGAGVAQLAGVMKQQMSPIPGFTQAEFDKLDPIVRDALLKAKTTGDKGAADVTKGVGDGFKGVGPAAKAGVEPAAPAVKDGMGKAADAGKEGSTLVVANVDFKPIVDKAREVFGQVPQAVTDGINGAVTAVNDGVTKLVAAARTGFERLGDTARTALGNKLSDAVTKACSDAERAMRDGVTAITTAANFAGIATSAETELAKIPVSVQTHLTAASAGVTQIGTAMVTSWQTNMAQLPVITNDTWAEVVRIITEQGRQAQTNAQTVADAILQVFLNLGQPMYVAGYNMMLRLAAGIQQGGQQAIIAAQNVARQIQGLFPQSPPKWGPLSGEGDTLKSGGRIGQRLAAGMENEADAVARAASTLAARVSGSLDGASPGQRAAAVSASSTAKSASAVSASSAPAAVAAGPSAAEMYAATKAGTEAAMAGMKVELKGDLVQFVSDGQRRDDRRAGRRSAR